MLYIARSHPCCSASMREGRRASRQAAPGDWRTRGCKGVPSFLREFLFLELRGASAADDSARRQRAHTCVSSTHIIFIWILSLGFIGMNFPSHPVIVSVYIYAGWELICHLQPANTSCHCRRPFSIRKRTSWKHSLAQTR
jgi:hypothetical protein